MVYSFFLQAMNGRKPGNMPWQTSVPVPPARRAAPFQAPLNKGKTSSQTKRDRNACFNNRTSLFYSAKLPLLSCPPRKPSASPSSTCGTPCPFSGPSSPALPNSLPGPSSQLRKKRRRKEKNGTRLPEIVPEPNGSLPFAQLRTRFARGGFHLACAFRTRGRFASSGNDLSFRSLLRGK